MVPPAEHTEELILQEQLAERESKTLSQRAAVLRVYNYYRIILSFLLMILFYEVPDQSFVGTYEPGWFQSVVLVYVILNVATGFYVLLEQNPATINTATIIGITVTDLVFIAALMITSGGVESGLDSLLIFAAAFGGVMIHGQISYLFPSSALILCFVSAVYSYMTDTHSLDHFFEVALIGVAAFVINALLQYVTDQLKKQELEVVSLATLERMRQLAEANRKELEEQYNRFNVLLTSTSEGVLGLDIDGTIIFANPMACELLDVEHEDLINTDLQDFLVTIDEDDAPAPAILKDIEVPAKRSFDPECWQTCKGESFIAEYKAEKTVNKEEERTGSVVLFKNVTALRAQEEQLQHLATHDALTNLPNRAHFNDILENALSRLARTDRYTAILLVDMDHFTVINEQVGQRIWRCHSD